MAPQKTDVDEGTIMITLPSSVVRPGGNTFQAFVSIVREAEAPVTAMFSGN